MRRAPSSSSPAPSTPKYSSVIEATLIAPSTPPGGSAPSGPDASSPSSSSEPIYQPGSQARELVIETAWRAGPHQIAARATELTQWLRRAGRISATGARPRSRRTSRRLRLGGGRRHPGSAVASGGWCPWHHGRTSAAGVSRPGSMCALAGGRSPAARGPARARAKQHRTEWPASGDPGVAVPCSSLKRRWVDRDRPRQKRQPRRPPPGTEWAVQREKLPRTWRADGSDGSWPI